MSSWILTNDLRDSPEPQTVVPTRTGHSLNHSRREVERCFLEFRDQVFRYLRALGCEHSIAEEITQEAFLRLYRTLQTGPRLNDERAWVFRVAKNLYIDCRRENHRFAMACDEGANTQNRTPSGAELDPEQQALQRERMRMIETEVLRLPELQRECMHLRAQGLRYREIAGALDLSLSAAVECIRSAVKKLGSVVSE